MSFDHENLLKSFEAGLYQNMFFIVSEYCANGSLEKYIRAFPPSSNVRPYFDHNMKPNL